VRVGGGSIVLLALNIANAYALVQEVRSILTSKTLKEGLQKTINLGKGIAKGYIEFGVLKFVFRSTPIAIGIQVFLGDMDMNLAWGRTANSIWKSRSLSIRFSPTPSSRRFTRIT
jgi:hypothetical protein